jgi:hypothetical protein
MVFSFLKEIEHQSEINATLQAAKKLGLKVSYMPYKKNGNINNCFPVVDLKETPNHIKLEFEELHHEYQQQEYQKMIRKVIRKISISLSVLVLTIGTGTIVKCTSKNNEPASHLAPKTIQKATLKKENTLSPSRLRDG